MAWRQTRNCSGKGAASTAAIPCRCFSQLDGKGKSLTSKAQGDTIAWSMNGSRTSWAMNVFCGTIHVKSCGHQVRRTCMGRMGAGLELHWKRTHARHMRGKIGSGPLLLLEEPISG